MTDEQCAKVVRRLSKPQQRALVNIPVNRPFRPAHTGFQWPTLSHLKALRLINAERDGLPGMGPNAMHVITGRGKAVRAYLNIVGVD